MGRYKSDVVSCYLCKLLVVMVAVVVVMAPAAISSNVEVEMW